MKEGSNLMLSAGTILRRKRFFSIGSAFFHNPFVVDGQNQFNKLATKSGSWSGIWLSSRCNADEAFADISRGTKSVTGRKSLYMTDTNRVMSGREPQAS